MLHRARLSCWDDETYGMLDSVGQPSLSRRPTFLEGVSLRFSISQLMKLSLKSLASLVQPTKPIVRGIQEIKHEPNLSLDKQQTLAVAYCHVVILDMEGEGNLSSGSTAYISPGSVMFLLRIPADS